MPTESLFLEDGRLSLDPDLSWGRLNMTPVAQMAKNPPAMQETQIGSLSWEDFLEKEMATDSRILAWEIPWTEEPDGL